MSFMSGPWGFLVDILEGRDQVARVREGHRKVLEDGDYGQHPKYEIFIAQLGYSAQANNLQGEEQRDHPPP